MMPKRDERKDNAFSVVEWAKSTKPRTVGRPCSTCKNQVVVDAIRKVLDIMVQEKYDIAIIQIHEMLQTKFNYKHTYGALKRHIYNCEQETWSKINGTS